MKAISSKTPIKMLVLVALLGGLCGLSTYTFQYANGTAYLSDDPQACVNCHIMNKQFDGWQHSSHQHVASCNNCHTPQAFASKWLIKGLNGWNHSLAFTTGNFPDPIRIRGFNAEVVQQNCIHCHQTLTSEISHTNTGQSLVCISCHGNVGHGK